MTPRTLRRILNLWPPFLFAGIRVTALSADFRQARVELRMRPWNRNYVGTHFGGSLFAMTDPFWMIMVKESLGRGRRRQGAALVPDRRDRCRRRDRGARAQAGVRAPQDALNGAAGHRAALAGDAVAAYARRPVDPGTT